MASAGNTGITLKQFVEIVKRFDIDGKQLCSLQVRLGFKAPVLYQPYRTGSNIVVRFLFTDIFSLLMKSQVVVASTKAI